MIAMQDRYRWEAEMPGGCIISRGGDLRGAVRFSLCPAPGANLPQHDLVGMSFLRRFNRAFVRALGGGLKEYVYCACCESFRVYVRATDGAVLVTPPNYELYL
jgi:hypothetical protein